MQTSSVLVIMINLSRDPITKNSPLQTTDPATILSIFGPIKPIFPPHATAPPGTSQQTKNNRAAFTATEIPVPLHPYLTAPSSPNLRHSSTPTTSTRRRACVLNPARHIVAHIPKYALDSGRASGLLAPLPIHPGTTPHGSNGAVEL